MKKYIDERSKTLLLDPHEIIKNVPAREWGPSKLIKSQEDVYPEFSINRINMPVRASNSGDGPGTDMIKAPFQYWGNKKLGEYNIELAKKTIEDFEKQSQDRDTIELDPNYSIYRDALNYIEHVEGLKKYLNLPYDVSVIRESKYKPTRLQNTNQKTYVFEESTKPGYWNDVVNDMVAESYDNHQYQDPTLNTFTAYRDFDEKGDFVSIYDEWDYNPAVIGGHKMLNKLIDSATGGKSFVVYDRIYLDDYYDIPKEARGNPFITPAIVTAEAKKSGGIIKAQNSAKLISKINQSNANFVKRLLDPNRKVIQNWVNPLDVSTHKLGWATEDTKQGAFVYPEVQEINGELIDFTHPSHRRSEGMNSAIERRDTVRMTPEQAKWFTENYKQYYPGFKDGGVLNTAGKIAGGFVPFYGTYLNWKDYKENPTLANLGWTIASGIGDIASLTGIGYGVVAGTKAIKAANTARKGVKAINTARKATRAANQIKMLEYGDVGKNAWKGWVASGKNLANSNKKLSEATKALQQAGVRFAIDGGIDTIDAGRTAIK